MSQMADALRSAFVSETELRLGPDERPASQAEAERVRDAAVKPLGAIGAWKLGATIAAVRADLGLERLFFGPIPQACVFEDGAELRDFQTRLRGVESEYAFELARDVRDDDLEREGYDFGDLFAGVRPAIEIPGTRYPALGQYGGFGLVADFGAVGGLVLGPARPATDLARLDKAGVRLAFAGEPVVTGSAEVIEGGATGPLRAFFRQAKAAGYALRAGQAIVTGSCTGYRKAALNARVHATFDALDASVSVVFLERP